jgi:hypothetical protein
MGAGAGNCDLLVARCVIGLALTIAKAYILPRSGARSRATQQLTHVGGVLHGERCLAICYFDDRPVLKHWHHSFAFQTAECMPYNGPGPRNSNELPKRKRKGNRKKQECIPMMMALLACYKSNAYASI